MDVLARLRCRSVRAAHLPLDASRRLSAVYARPVACCEWYARTARGLRVLALKTRSRPSHPAHTTSLREPRMGALHGMRWATAQCSTGVGGAGPHRPSGRIVTSLSPARGRISVRLTTTDAPCAPAGCPEGPLPPRETLLNTTRSSALPVTSKCDASAPPCDSATASRGSVCTCGTRYLERGVAGSHAAYLVCRSVQVVGA